MVSDDILYQYGAVEKRISKGETLIQEGEIPVFYYQVLSGEVRLVNYNDKGKEMIQPVEDRLGHDFRYSVKIDKVKALGYTPDYSFEKGLETTIEWYRDNEDWWKPLKGDKFTVK